jgi:hypothetical protein
MKAPSIATANTAHFGQWIPAEQGRQNSFRPDLQEVDQTQQPALHFSP